MTNDEKIIALQTLGRLLEAQYPYSDPEIKQGPVPRSVFDGENRETLKTKILAIVESMNVGQVVQEKKSLATAFGTAANMHVVDTTTNGSL